MKIILLPFLIILFLFSSSPAEQVSCHDSVDVDFKLLDVYGRATKYREDTKIISFTVKNKTDRKIIYTATFQTKDKKIFSNLSFGVPPFGQVERRMDLSNKNMDMIWNKEVSPYKTCVFADSSSTNNSSTKQKINKKEYKTKKNKSSGSKSLLKKLLGK